MEALAARIQTLTERPVTTDPRNVGNAPCVLVEPPDLDLTQGNATLCGSVLGRFPVFVIGTSAARAELGPVADLLAEVLDGDLGITTASLTAYVPLNNAATADPSLAYRITVEELISDGD